MHVVVVCVCVCACVRACVRACVCVCDEIIIITKEVISIAPYLVAKCQHTVLFQINSNVDIKPHK